jgi:hypothetical protein
MYIDEEGKEKQRKEKEGKGGEQRYMTVYDTQIITLSPSSKKKKKIYYQSFFFSEIIRKEKE